jgi:hypothetical protein
MPWPLPIMHKCNALLSLDQFLRAVLHCKLPSGRASAPAVTPDADECEAVRLRVHLQGKPYSAQTIGALQVNVIQQLLLS